MRETNRNLKRQRRERERKKKVSTLQTYKISLAEELAGEKSLYKKKERRVEKERLAFKGNVNSLKFCFKVCLREQARMRRNYLLTSSKSV